MSGRILNIQYGGRIPPIGLNTEPPTSAPIDPYLKCSSAVLKVNGRSEEKRHASQTTTRITIPRNPHTMILRNRSSCRSTGLSWTSSIKTRSLVITLDLAIFRLPQVRRARISLAHRRRLIRPPLWIRRRIEHAHHFLDHRVAIALVSPRVVTAQRVGDRIQQTSVAERAGLLGLGAPLRQDLGQIVFFFQAEDGIRDGRVTGVQTCALPICRTNARPSVSAMPTMRAPASAP